MSLAPGANPVILVVDDNPNNLNVLSDCLARAGFATLLKRSGEKAIELIHRRLPDLILLDIIMPGIDGFETLKRLKAREDTRAIPVIFMTALTDTVDKVKGLELGAVDYITKPFHHDEVLARVRTHLTLKRLQADLVRQNQRLSEALDRERRLMENLRLNLSISLPHELRTPLNAILGFSGFAADERNGARPEEIRRYAGMIHQSALRLHRLVENSLLYANLRLLRFASDQSRRGRKDNFVEVADLAPAVAEQRADAAGRREDLTLDLTPAYIAAAPRNIEKILGEVLDNAFKFSEPGTPVSVRGTLNGNLYMLGVTDRGRGMTAAQIDEIGAYVQFDRRRHEQQGTGMGLIIAQLLTRLEDGVFSIDSDPERGTAITIVLPCRVASPPIENDERFWLSAPPEGDAAGGITGFHRPADPGDGASGNGVGAVSRPDPPRVMVVSDRKDNRRCIARLLEPIGLCVLEATHMRQAMSDALSRLPDIIFIDAWMLATDGFELIHRLRAGGRSNDVRVVAVGAGPADAELRDQFRRVCDDIILAPAPAGAFLDRIQSLLGLEWLRSDTGDADMTLPPAREIRLLRDMAAGGRVMDIRERCDRLASADDRNAAFTDAVRGFADTFQLKALRRYLERRLADLPDAGPGSEPRPEPGPEPGPETPPGPIGGPDAP